MQQVQEFLRQSLKIRNLHLFFPKVIGCICAILLVIIIIQRLIRCIRTGTPFINLKSYHFFDEGCDKLKLFGSLALTIGYLIALPVLHFVNASMIFIFLFGVLFDYNREKGFSFMSVLISAIIAVAGSWLTWYLFFQIFNITLP